MTSVNAEWVSVKVIWVVLLYVILYTWPRAVWYLNLWTKAVLVIFSTVHLKEGGFFRCIPHRPGISRANKPSACHISMGVSLAPRRKIPNHSFPLLNWHTEARARKRLVSYKRETGRGNWGGEQKINLITRNVPFLLASSYLGIKTFWLVSQML